MVFTKYDTLVEQKTMELLGTAGTDDEEQLIHDAKDGAEKDFDRLCVQPLTEIFKTKQKESPLVTKVSDALDLDTRTKAILTPILSVNPGYEETLPELVQFTKQVVTDVMHQSGQLQTMSSAQNGQILDVHTLVQMSTA
ncbi:hypothetical protein FRC02_011913 [Tulasnella sp. 418]|nr:hypothetical protein FRC02_011913 [Tulasnella sp. 418]